MACLMVMKWVRNHTLISGGSGRFCVSIIDTSVYLKSRWPDNQLIISNLRLSAQLLPPFIVGLNVDGLWDSDSERL